MRKARRGALHWLTMPAGLCRRCGQEVGNNYFWPLCALFAGQGATALGLIWGNEREQPPLSLDASPHFSPSLLCPCRPHFSTFGRILINLSEIGNGRQEAGQKRPRRFTSGEKSEEMMRVRDSVGGPCSPPPVRLIKTKRQGLRRGGWR